METAYLYNLCIFFIMAIFFNYIWNKREHKGKLEKKEFFLIVLVAPFLIAMSFFIGRFFEGNSLKFILTLGPAALLWLYLEFKPNSFKQYDPILKKYGGLFMAVILAFLITGCTTTKEPEPKITDTPKKDVMQRISDQPSQEELSKKQGHGTLR